MNKFKYSITSTQLSQQEKDQAGLYPGFIQLPYPDESVVDIRKVQSAANYIALHRNLKKKIRAYRNKGGIIEIIKGALDEDTRALILKVVEYAAESGIDKVYFGPVLNETKRRMMNRELKQFIS